MLLLGPVRAKASGRVDVYTQGQRSSLCVGLDFVASRASARWRDKGLKKVFGNFVSTFRHHGLVEMMFSVQDFQSPWINTIVQWALQGSFHQERQERSGIIGEDEKDGKECLEFVTKHTQVFKGWCFE